MLGDTLRNSLFLFEVVIADMWTAFWEIGSFTLPNAVTVVSDYTTYSILTRMKRAMRQNHANTLLLTVRRKTATCEDANKLHVETRGCLVTVCETHHFCWKWLGREPFGKLGRNTSYPSSTLMQMLSQRFQMSLPTACSRAIKWLMRWKPRNCGPPHSDNSCEGAVKSHVELNGAWWHGETRNFFSK